MSEETEHEATPEPPVRRYSRRRLLSTTAATAGVAAVGGAIGGALVMQGAGTPPVVNPAQRRRFEGKVVIVTGATSGIGRSAAKLFAAEGARVGFCGRRQNLGAQVEQEIRQAGGEAAYIQADVRDEASVRGFVDEVVRRYGGLDTCFNNAGITIQKPLHELSSAEWDDVVGTDLRGNFLALKYQIPHLIERGGGTVVVTSSSNALSTTENKAAYTAAKHGIVGMVNSAAFDYARYNIRINTLIPGTTDTELVRRAAGAENLPDAAWHSMAAVFGKSSVPALKRLATPDEIALGALALASGDFPFMTAAPLVLDGGMSAYT